MGNKKSIAAGSSGGAKNTEQSSAVPKGAIPRSRVNIQWMQNVLLIWLDNNIEHKNEDCRNTVSELRRVVNDVHTYTDGDQCIQFINTINNNKVCMIIRGYLGQLIMPRVHDMPQVDSIFIFCGNKARHEQWAQEWPKIKGVFTKISPICEALKIAAQQCEHNAISMSFLTTSTSDAYTKTFDRLDPSFMYTQILKEILLTIKFEQKHIKQYSDYCREAFVRDGREPKSIDKLEREYHNKTPICCYTSEAFVYSMLNRALRLMDVDIIVRMGFFINDLHQHIHQLHSEQRADQSSREIFLLYRGQGLSKKDFEQMAKTKDGLISFNSFLSTSKDRDVSLAFAKSNQDHPDLVGILFTLAIDPAQSTTPFASIRDVSYFQGEDEVLFAMHTVFRINDIKPMDGSNRLFDVNLTLTGDNDQDMRALTDHIREESFPDNKGWYRLGLMLLKMGQFDKAQEVYEVLLEQTTDESEKGPIYHQLGCVKDGQGEYQEAITFYEKALAIQQQSLPPNHPDLASSYNNIGMVHSTMGHYPKALSYYEKDLAIGNQSLPPNHPHLASSYNNIGNVYGSMGDFPKALSYYEKALAIKQQSLPTNHPDLAQSYNNIGIVYRHMGDYPQALSSYEKALAIQQQSLPPNHPHLASSYNNIGNVYGTMGDYPKALSSYEKALAISQQSLPANHPDLAGSYKNIGNVYNSMGDYPMALSYYEKALAIKRQSLPPNHPDLSTSYVNIGDVCDNMADCPKPLSSHERALAISQQTLTPDHPDLARSYNNIGLVYYNTGDYPQALSSYEKALAIKQQSLPPNHPSFASTYNNIGNVYNSMGDYPQALSSYKKALAIQQQSLPPNHPDFAQSYNNIGNVYDNMGDYPKALSSHEKALAIRQQSLPQNHPDLAQSYNNIGMVFYSMSDFPKAVSSYEKALTIQEQSLPPNHPDLAGSYNNIGMVWYRLGDYPIALSYYEESLAIQKRSLPPNHRDLAASYNNIGAVYQSMDDYWKARSYFERAVDIGQQSLPTNHPHLQLYKTTEQRINSCAKFFMQTNLFVHSNHVINF
jgi:tetratricopeptide (TPR) repeat protein